VASNPEPTGDFITLARVVKTQGRRGEVAAEIHSDVPDRFAVGMKLQALGNVQTARRDLELEEFWPHKGLLVLKFAGIDSISDAEALVGSELQVPKAERAQLDPGWMFVSDLIGSRFFDHGREVGRIADVQFGAGEAPLLIVSGPGESGEVATFDVPFAEAYIEAIDAAKREVRMKLPEGMLEINAPMRVEEKERFERERLKPRRKGSGK
jgi:16S rRNA processing protein RimM